MQITATKAKNRSRRAKAAQRRILETPRLEAETKNGMTGAKYPNRMLLAKSHLLNTSISHNGMAGSSLPNPKTGNSPNASSNRKLAKSLAPTLAEKLATGCLMTFATASAGVLPKWEYLTQT